MIDILSVDLKSNADGPGKYLQNHELRKIADFKLQCDVTTLNLKDTKAALNVCFDNSVPNKWYQDPYLIVGGIVISFAVGGAIVYVLEKEYSKNK